MTDLAEMERWVDCVVRLIDHAADRATDGADRDWLRGALEDAESLREALADARVGDLDTRRVDIVRSVYLLWDANHDRTERLASAVDPAWHAEWLQRSAGARTSTSPTSDELPLRTVA